MKKQTYSLCSRAISRRTLLATPFATPAAAQTRGNPQSSRPNLYQPPHIRTYDGPVRVGHIMIEQSLRRLHFLYQAGAVLTYSIGIGQSGMAMQDGSYTIERKAIWPRWRPTERMRRENPSLPAVMAGGLQNPLGARALYLQDSDGNPTLYRIHGTNRPETVGGAESSGCFRMLNNEVSDLFERVATGAHVFVTHAPVRGIGQSFGPFRLLPDTRPSPQPR